MNLKADIVIWIWVQHLNFSNDLYSSSEMWEDCEVSGAESSALGFIEEAGSGELRAALSPLGKEDPLVSHHVLPFKAE